MEPIPRPTAKQPKVNGVVPLTEEKDQGGLGEKVKASVGIENVNTTEQGVTSIEIEDHEAVGIPEQVETPDRIEDPEDINITEQIESSDGIDGLEDLDEIEQVEPSDGIDNSEDVQETGEIKEERDEDVYPDYDMIKKEEPDDDHIDKMLPELGEINDMFDDVDGPEYVDLDYEGIAEVDGVDCFVCEEFKIRQVPKPVIVTRPLYQLFDCIVSEHIILDPDYQREVVWDEGRAALLISSILTGYFIPPIIFNCVQREVELPDGTDQMQHKRICIDGKQRLTSIWKFMTGQIGFFDSNKPQKKWYFCQPSVDGSNVERNILPNAVKEFFKNQAFCCYEYDELTQDTEETMFQLVQKGIALTPAEKMRAMSTEWATLAKEFEDMYPTVVNLSKQNRASGFRLILVIFAMIQEVLGATRKKVFGPETTPTLQASTTALSRLLENKDPIDPDMKLMLKSVFDKYETLVRLSSTELSSNRWKIDRDSAFDPSPIYLRSQEIDYGRTFSPLELVATAILITVHAENHTDEDLLEDVKWMRHYLRASQKDLRLNGTCWKITWEFINVELDLRRSGKRPSPAFMTHEIARKLALQKKATAAKKKATPKAMPKPKAKPKSIPKKSKPAPKPSSSKPKPKRATPFVMSEPLFPNLARNNRSKVAGEAASSADVGESLSDSDGDTLSEYESLSELEEEIIRIGKPRRPAKIPRGDSTETEDDMHLPKRPRSIVVEIPQYDPKRARLS